MPTANLDVVPMHPDNCYWKCTCYEDSYMRKDTLGDFEEYFSSIAGMNLENFEATLASKEELFSKEKAFPYFKALFKEGKETYIREFGNDSTFWLRSEESMFFTAVNYCGDCILDECDYSLRGFRPLIILDGRL